MVIGVVLSIDKIFSSIMWSCSPMQEIVIILKSKAKEYKIYIVPTWKIFDIVATISSSLQLED
jgi:hypothetical protein